MKKVEIKTKELFGVYVGGEWERNVGFLEAQKIFAENAGRAMDWREAFDLKAGKGLYVSATVYFE